jgi:hypothetical protein
MPVETPYSADGLLDAIGGVFLVVLFYWFRFHSLKGTRSYTRAALYYSGLICFVFPFVTLYLFVVVFVSPVAAVWIMIGVWLVPWIPGAWRNCCHKMAEIPIYAHRFKEILTVAPFDLREEDTPIVQRKLARLGFLPDDFRAVHATVIQARFLKMVTIMHHLEKWEQNYDTFMQRNSETYHSLLMGFDILSFKIIRAVKSIAKINSTIIHEGTQSGWQSDDWHTLNKLAEARNEPLFRVQSATQVAMGAMIEDLRKDIDFFLDVVLLFVARGVLSNEWTFSRRRQKLETMGFEIVQPPPSIVPSVLSAVVILVICSILWIGIIGISTSGRAEIAGAKIITISVLNLLLNFFLIFHLKQRYAFANSSIFGAMPIVFILTVGFIAALLEIPVRAVFDYFQFWEHHQGSISAFLLSSGSSLMWSLFPWVTGATTAFLAQDAVWNAMSSRLQKRVLDGLVFGGGWAAGVSVIWAVNHWGFRIDGMDLPIEIGLPFSFGVGFLLGFLVLTEIRDGSS